MSVQQFRLQLEKKSTFEKALNSLITEAASRAAGSIDADVWSAVTRCHTLLKARYTGINFWKLGLRFYQTCQCLQLDSNQTSTLQQYVKEARSFLNEEDVEDAAPPYDQQQGLQGQQGSTAQAVELQRRLLDMYSRQAQSRPSHLSDVGLVLDDSPRQHNSGDSSVITALQEAIMQFTRTLPSEPDSHTNRQPSQPQANDSTNHRGNGSGSASSSQGAYTRSNPTTNTADRETTTTSTADREVTTPNTANMDVTTTNTADMDVTTTNTADRDHPHAITNAGPAGPTNTTTSASDTGNRDTSSTGARTAPSRTTNSSNRRDNVVSTSHDSQNNEARTGNGEGEAGIGNGEDAASNLNGEDGVIGSSVLRRLELLEGGSSLQQSILDGIQAVYSGMEAVARGTQAVEAELDSLLLSVLTREGEQRPAGPPPASKKLVASLPQLVVTEQLLESWGRDTRCPVCTEYLQVKDVVVQLPCGHTYHPDCLKPWLDQHNSCPTCRHELPTDDPAYEARKEREAEEAEDRRGAQNALSHNEFMYI